MPSLTVISVARPPSGRVLVRFSDKSTLEFGSIAEFRRTVRAWRDEFHNRESLKRFALAWWVARDNNLDADAQVQGKTITVDLSTASPIEVA